MRTLVSLSLTGSEVLLHGVHHTRIPARDGHWGASIGQALALCRSHDPEAKLDVAVQLGLDHARMAIMAIEQPGGLTSVPVARHEPLVHAWATQMLHVDPAEQVIRWRMLADPRKVLVSCVRRGVAENIETACADANARLVSCRPAIAVAMDAAPSLPQERTLIWMEDGSDGSRHAVVQLLRFRGGSLTTCWRGWLPGDDEIEPVLARFEAETGGSVSRQQCHWPSHTV